MPSWGWEAVVIGPGKEAAHYQGIARRPTASFPCSTGCLLYPTLLGLAGPDAIIVPAFRQACAPAAMRKVPICHRSLLIERLVSHSCDVCMPSRDQESCATAG